MTFGIEPWHLAPRDKTFKIAAAITIGSWALGLGGCIGLIMYQLHEDAKELKQRQGIERQATPTTFTPSPERQ